MVLFCVFLICHQPTNQSSAPLSKPSWTAVATNLPSNLPFPRTPTLQQIHHVIKDGGVSGGSRGLSVMAHDRSTTRGTIGPESTASPHRLSDASRGLSSANSDAQRLSLGGSSLQGLGPGGRLSNGPEGGGRPSLESISIQEAQHRQLSDRMRALVHSSPHPGIVAPGYIHMVQTPPPPLPPARPLQPYTTATPVIFHPQTNVTIAPPQFIPIVPAASQQQAAAVLNPAVYSPAPKNPRARESATPAQQQPCTCAKCTARPNTPVRAHPNSRRYYQHHQPNAGSTDARAEKRQQSARSGLVNHSATSSFV